VDFLAERVVGRSYQDATLRKEPFLVQTFADLEVFFRAIFDHLETQSRGGEIWRTHHVATIRKIRNRLGNISTRSKGLVTEDGVVNDLPWGEFADRTMYVVDVAGLDPLAQEGPALGHRRSGHFSLSVTARRCIRAAKARFAGRGKLGQARSPGST